jgi:hypothetical protein
MTKDFHTCEECFDGITKEIMSKFTGCKCPACMSLLNMAFNVVPPKKDGKKECLNGKCSYDSSW